MPYYPVVIRGRSSSLSNPCPDGTAIGYGDWNGTILVICDAAFVKTSTASEVDISLALGLGLGIGLPVLLMFLFLVMRAWKKKYKYKYSHVY